MRKVFFIFFLIAITYGNSFAQNQYPTQLTGCWINTAYENIMQNLPGDERLAEMISPKYIYFDSLGICTLQTGLEQRTKIGKAIKVRSIGGGWQLTYIFNKSHFNINEVIGRKDIIYVSFTEVSVGILFKRYIPE